MLPKRVGLSAYSLPYGLMTIMLWCYTRIARGRVSLVWQKAEKSISPQPQADKRQPKKKKKDKFKRKNYHKSNQTGDDGKKENLTNSTILPQISAKRSHKSNVPTTNPTAKNITDTSQYIVNIDNQLKY
jgi:hypothetical protein